MAFEFQQDPDGPRTRERTTTVVLGPTHLAAIAALVIVLCAGIVVLAFAAFRSRSAPVFEAPVPVAAAEQPGEGPPADKPTAAGPEPAAAATRPRVVAPRRAEPAAGPPAARAAAPAGTAGTAAPRAAPASAAAAVPSPPLPAPDMEHMKERAAAAGLEEAPAALPSAAFDNVRVVVPDGEGARETRGVLRIGNGTVALGDSIERARVLSSLDSVTAIFYSRSRHPRWRDAAGEKAASRVDLGKMGFLRGDSNWLILVTGGAPVILSVEDSQVRQVTQAIEARTGRTVQRFQ